MQNSYLTTSNSLSLSSTWAIIAHLKRALRHFFKSNGRSPCVFFYLGSEKNPNHYVLLVKPLSSLKSMGLKLLYSCCSWKLDLGFWNCTSMLWILFYQTCLKKKVLHPGKNLWFSLLRCQKLQAGHWDNTYVFIFKTTFFQVLWKRKQYINEGMVLLQ